MKAIFDLTFSEGRVTSIVFKSLSKSKVKHILPEDEAFLAHYGVKGMKWGVRKADPSKPRRKSARRQVREYKFKTRREDRANSKLRKQKTPLTPDERRQLVKSSKRQDSRSNVDLGIASTLLAGGIGGYVVSRIAKSSKLRSGAAITGTLLSLASIPFSISSSVQGSTSFSNKYAAVKDLPMNEVSKYLDEKSKDEVS